MANPSKDNSGIIGLIKNYVDRFRIPENLNHYSGDDYEKAEKLFVKFCLREGWISHTHDS